MSPSRFAIRHSTSGVAIVLILAFLVLLSGVVLAFFSRAMSERRISNSSASQTKVELFAQGATDQIIGDLKQEIADGSTLTIVGTGTTIYTPSSSSNMVPQPVPTINGSGALANLIKTSVRGQPFSSGANVTSRAASVNSNTNPSLNNRYVSPARWNKPLLMPATSSTNLTPATSGTNAFTAPDWVLVGRDGSNPTSWSASLTAANSGAVVGRYAYNIYDEGGLLDANVAGYPIGGSPPYTATNSDPVGLYKSAEAFADLSQIGFATQAQINSFVGWRNYASSGASGSLSGGYTLGTGANSTYGNSILSNWTGFLNVSNTTLNNGQTDRMFSSRQQLINFLQNGIGLPVTNQAFQCLTHFSRAINQPSYIAAVQTSASAPVVLPVSVNLPSGGNSAVGGDKLINPSFPNTRVQTSFTRNDGTTAKAGDPLVNKRFALNRLAWVTYKGPSGSRTQSDPDIQSLITNGIPWSYLKLGTAANIQKYFGLTWDSANGRWKYDLHRGTNSLAQRIIMSVGRPTGTAADPKVFVQDANRDPDFFELLKAGIAVGSLGKAAVTSATAVSQADTASGYKYSEVPANMRYALDSSVDYHIIQIGANILSEVNPTSYPIRITFSDQIKDSTTGLEARPNWEFQGVTDLPYLSYVFNGVLRMEAPNPAHASGGGQTADASPFQYPIAVNQTLTAPGYAYMVQVPAVWNPYDPNGTPGVLRPSQFRVVVDSLDPVSVINGSSDYPIWHGAVADSSTNPYDPQHPPPNAGLGPPHAVYSWNVTGLGKTTEIPGTNGTQITDAVTFNDANGSLYREPTVIFSTTAAGNATRVTTLANRSAGNVSPVPGDITSLDANPLPAQTGGSVTDKWAPLVLGQFPLAFAKDNTNTLTYYTGVGLIGYAGGNGDNRVYFTYRLQYKDAGGNWVTYDTKYGRTTHGFFAFQSRFDQGSPRFSPSVVTASDLGFNPYSWASAMDPRTARFGLIMDALNIQRSQAWSVAAPASAGWIYNSSGAAAAATDGITYPIRPDNSKGFYFANFEAGNLPLGGATAPNQTVNFPSTKDIPYPSFAAGWTAPVTHISADVWMFAPGMYAQNDPSAPFYDGSTVQPSYYADADGVVRRAAGAYVPVGSGLSASTPVGLPPASINGYSGAPQTPATTPANKTPFTQSQSRPLLLHRPFRTVAELGYVFRDLPWKNLDFFTPESADAALLDLFCIAEPTADSNGMVAGKVNLNTRQAPVLAAIVSGAYVDDPKITNATVGSVSPTLATSVGTALTARTADTTNGPLQNISELVGKWNAAVGPAGPAYSPSSSGSNTWSIDLSLANGYKDGQQSYIGFSGNLTGTTSGKDLSAVYTPATSGSLMESMAYVQRFREAPIRALASVGQTRVWNLMIDVVAQTGRYPQSATALDKFVVEGEQRYWVHVAIDRLTGQVIDKQIEVVKE